MFRTHARARDLAALTGAVAIVGLCVSRWSASGRLSMLQAHADSQVRFPGTGSLLYHKGDDANAFAVDLGAASKKERLLTARDDAARSAARQHASADLNRYDVAFSEGLDEYARRSKKIDALSRRVFVKYRPQKKPAKPAYDPLSDVRNVWEKWGANSEPVLGVPQEYDGWKATTTAHPSTLKHLPDYVVRAQRELGGGAVASVANGWHSHPVRPPRGQSRGRDAHRHAPAAPAALKPQAAAIVSSASAHTTAPRPSPVEPASGAGTRSSADAQSPPEMVQTAAEPQPEADEAPAQTTAASTTRGADTSLGAGRAGGGARADAAAQPTLVWAKAVPIVGNDAAHAPADTYEAAHVSADTHASITPVAAAVDFASTGARASASTPARTRARPSAATVAMVKRMAQNYEASAVRLRQARSASQQAGGGGKVRVGGEDEVAALRRERISLVREGQRSAVQGHLVQDSEAQQIAALKSEVKQMRERARVHRLRRQVQRLKAQLKRHMRASGARSAEHTHILGGVDDASEGGDEAAVVGDGVNVSGGGLGKGDEEKAREAVKQVVTHAEARHVKVCDGFGCRTQALPAAELPHVQSEKTIKEELQGKGLMDVLFPDPHTWKPEVHLNAKGQIRADHDDPNGHLMPHNKFQHAEYPANDGGQYAHIRRDPAAERPGLTNRLGSRLFRDTIVEAAPGFNAGTGRHVRAQEGVDWERNWETHRVSRHGGHIVGDEVAWHWT